MTADELLAMPDDGDRHELVRGELVTMSPSGTSHSRISLRMARHLAAFVERHNLGEVYGSNLGYIIARDPDTVREPDTSFIRADRVINTEKYFSGAPDLAVEVISPNDRWSEVEEKVREYLAAGTRMVVVIDPRRKTAFVRTLTSATDLTIDDTLSGGDVVPGWSLPLRDLFS